MSKKNKYEEFDDDFEFDDEEESAINWGELFHKLYVRKKLFIISTVITIIIATPLLLTVPKYYTVEVKLAPEFSSMNNSSSSLSGLSSLMKSFGIGNSNNSNGDAILPNLYPDLMNSTAFLVSLFNVPVKSKDGKINTTYYEYLSKHQKAPIWSEAIGGVMKGISELFPDDSDKKIANSSKAANAGHLTKAQATVVHIISRKVVCDVDKKTGVITIDVEDQDPIICTTIADSTCQRLQEFITEYRTKKARMEMQNAYKQYIQTKVAYEEAKECVESFNDANWDLVDEDMIIKKQALANDMQTKFTNMSTFNQQYLGARSKYESLRPVFTVLDGASVPLKPSGPSRKKAILILLVLVLGLEAAWILLKDKLKGNTADTNEAVEA